MEGVKQGGRGEVGGVRGSDKLMEGDRERKCREKKETCKGNAEREVKKLDAHIQ